MTSRVMPYLILAAAAVLFFGDLVRHPTWALYSDQSDLLGLHVAPLRFLVRSWQQTGELPLWNPYSFAGMPFAHDIQVPAHYPLHLPLYWLHEGRMAAALTWLLVAHIVLAGWGMYAYARTQGLSPVGALVAGFGFMFAGKWMIHLLVPGHYMFAGLAWLPWVLLGLERAIRRGSPLAATGAGVAYGVMILGTHPQIILYSGLFIALWTLAPALERAGYLAGEGDRSRRRLAAALGAWLGFGIGTVAIAVGLSSIVLLPGIEAAGQSTRALVGEASSRPGSLLVTFCLLFGPPLTGPIQHLSFDWEFRGGLDALWASAAIAAPLLYGGRIRLQAAITGMLVAFALGGGELIRNLPVFHLFTFPARMLLIGGLPMALLAGATTDRLLEGSDRGIDARKTVRRIVPILVAIALILGAIPVVAMGPKGLGPRAYWIALFGSPLLAYALLRRGAVGPDHGHRGGPSAWALGWVGLLVFNLVSISRPYVEVRPASGLFIPSPCVRYLSGRGGVLARVLDRSIPDADVPRTPLGTSLPLLAGIEAVSGYNSLDIFRFKEFLNFIADRDEPPAACHVVYDFPIRNKALLDLLGVRFLMQPSDPSLVLRPSQVIARSPHDKSPSSEPGWRLVEVDPSPSAFVLFFGPMQFPSYSVFENLDALPRAFVVPEAAPMPDRSLALSALKGNDFRRRVLLEGFEPGRDARAPDEAFRPATIREYRPNRVVIEVDGRPGYLVLADIWFPGWTCTVDGESTPIRRANYLFRCVPLPNGARRLVFSFAPASYRIGKLISGATVLTIVVIVALFARGRAIRLR